MNQNLKNHYQNIVSYDLITKFHFTNIFHILKIEKICLNIGFEENLFDKQKIINILLFLKLITNQIPFQKPKISLHIKKNTITGCQITLRKKNISG